MLRFASAPTQHTSYEITIRRDPAGRWVAEESHGSLGGIFVSREAAVRFALRETDGDANRVHVESKPAPSAH
jgi:hypothetical protein